MKCCRSEFGQTLGSKGVHIIDPFTGTGTFITRLLQSGLITPEEMAHKYRHEIHANEIVLLAYYIAAINIEAVYHGLLGGEYVPFEGICLTDTFQMYEKRRPGQRSDGGQLATGASGRRSSISGSSSATRPIRSGQAARTTTMPTSPTRHLDGRIRDTYAAQSTAHSTRTLYDSYIRAIRWASDRIGDSGVMAYVTNAGWVDGNAADGLRACLAEEFSEHLRVPSCAATSAPAARLSRREGGKIFGAGSRAPIAITLLVKNPSCSEARRNSLPRHRRLS